MPKILPEIPPLYEMLDSTYVLDLPLRVRFRGIDHRETLLIKGPAGWGEFAPFVEYDDDEAAWWLASAIEAAWFGWPEPKRERVKVNATVPAIDPSDVDELLLGFPDCDVVKVKVAEAGQQLDDDIARVRQVRAVLGTNARIRVDANGAWSVEQALEALTALSVFGLDYVEQPCATTGDLVKLKQMLRENALEVRIAADESIRKADDPLAVAKTGAIDVAVLKVAPLGGVKRTLHMAKVLKNQGVQVVISSALESSVGIAAGLAAAAALPEEPPACGLATAGLLAADVSSATRATGGSLPVGAIEPDMGRVLRFAAESDRHDWWLDRLARCHRALTELARSSR